MLLIKKIEGFNICLKNFIEIEIHKIIVITLNSKTSILYIVTNLPNIYSIYKRDHMTRSNYVAAKKLSISIFKRKNI